MSKIVLDGTNPKYAEKYRRTHRVELAKKSSEYYYTHKVEKAKKMKEYRQTHKAELAKRDKDRSLQLKIDAITHYGKEGKPVCVLCGNNGIKHLTIDHINGGGIKERKAKRLHAGNSFYNWLRKNNYPEGYQTLCMNCQWDKKVKNKELTMGKSGR